MRNLSFASRSFALLCWALFVVSLGCSEESQGDETSTPAARLGGAVVVRVEGELTTATLSIVARAIAEAERDGRDVLVIDLDTPGGSLDTMRSLANLIKDATSPELRTLTWVHDRATSAGVLVTLATQRVFMAPRSTVGASTPVTIGPGGIAPITEEGGVRAKIMSDMRVQFRSWAEDQQRPGLLAEAMIDSEIAVLQVRVDGEVRYVSRSEWSDIRDSGVPASKERTLSPSGELLSLTAQEAVAMGFADGIAETLEDVLEKAGANDREPLLVVAKTSERLLAWFDFWTPILIGFGLMLAFTELKMPGFGLPGILSLVCFALAFGGRYFVGLADVPQLVLVAIGFALVAVELFAMPGTVWFGLVGGLCIIGGIFWSQLGPGFSFTNPLDQRFAFDGVYRLLLTTGGALIASMFLVRFLPHVPMANRLIVNPRVGATFGDGLPQLEEARLRAEIGALGEVLTDLRPVGKVLLQGDADHQFEARAPGGLLARGTQVVVVEVNGDRLVVEAVPQEEA